MKNEMSLHFPLNRKLFFKLLIASWKINKFICYFVCFYFINKIILHENDIWNIEILFNICLIIISEQQFIWSCHDQQSLLINVPIMNNDVREISWKSRM